MWKKLKKAVRRHRWKMKRNQYDIAKRRPQKKACYWRRRKLMTQKCKAEAWREKQERRETCEGLPSERRKAIIEVSNEMINDYENGNQAKCNQWLFYLWNSYYREAAGLMAPTQCREILRYTKYAKRNLAENEKLPIQLRNIETRTENTFWLRLSFYWRLFYLADYLKRRNTFERRK